MVLIGSSSATSRASGSKTARRGIRPLLSVSALALLAGCGGEDGAGSYLSRFDAPDALDAAVLSAGALLPADIVTLTTNLLATDKYQGLHTIGWTAFLADGRELVLESEPLRSSGAAFAHAAGYTGSGQTIAVSDGQYLSGYAVFANTAVTIVNNWTGPNAPGPHGTVVSAVAVGDAVATFNSPGYIGIAPDANLMFGTYETTQKLADLGNAATAAGAVAWNNSWGYPELFLNASDFDRAFATDQGDENYLAALDAFAAQGVVVFAVSNDNRLRHSTLMDGLPALRPSLEAGWLAVVNGVPTFSGAEDDPTPDIASVQLLSSACYEAARWCLIADGGWQVPDTDLRLDPEGSTVVTGSSFAAPQVSGALAILADAFPGLDAHALRVRLLASAEDDFFSPNAYVELAEGFDKGYSFTYGHGFLDIAAALQPIGGAAVALSDGSSVSVSRPALVSGLAMGDALERALDGTEIEVRDALSARFAMPARGLLAAGAPVPHASVLMADAMRSVPGAARLAPARPLADPFAALQGETLAMVAPDGGMEASVLVPPAGTASAGLMLSAPVIEGPTRVDLGLTVARDHGGTLALGAEAATLASLSLGVVQDLGAEAYLSMSAEVGVADLGTAGALADNGTATFNRIGLEAGRSNVFGHGDRLSIAIGMPVAVTSGQTRITVPVIREAAAAGLETLDVGLAPEARQMDLTLRYVAPVAERMDVTFSVAHSENFGNRAGATDTGGALVLSLRF